MTTSTFRLSRNLKNGSIGEVNQISKVAIKNTLKKIKQFLDISNNELFFASCIILCEGDCEKLAIPKFEKKIISI